MKGVAILLALLPLAASAATITVTSSADNLSAADGHCTLREAIANVNAAADTTGGDCAAGTGTGDTIRFAFVMPAKIRLKLGELLIQRDVSIENAAPASLHIDGFGKTRLLEIAAGITSMSNVTLEHGRALTLGGGVLVDNGATLDLAGSVVAGNSAIDTRDVYGGGIYNAGGLKLTRCVITGNTAGLDPNGDGGLVLGGGIYNVGMLMVIDSTLTRNTISAASGTGLGAAVYNGDGATAELATCWLSGNRVVATAESGQANGGAIHEGGGSMTLTDCTLTKNRVKGGGFGAYGGAISVNGGMLSLTRCTLSHNSAIVTHSSGGAFGGAIYGEPLGNITSIALSDCGLTKNVAAAANGFVAGGAVYNSGDLTVNRCTVNGNAALSHGFEVQVYGGGISINGGPLIMTNSTVAGNSAKGASISQGGGIDATYVVLTNCTITGNKVQLSHTSDNFGGINSFQVTLTNTIVANNGGKGNCLAQGTSGGHNLISDGTCVAGGGTDLVNTNPRLDPAGPKDNGGPTQTIALCTRPGTPIGCRAASPAIDAADDTVTGPPDNLITDQRGLPRLSGTHVDIGAYEVQ